MRDNVVTARTIDLSFKSNLKAEVLALRKKTAEDIVNGVEDYRYWVGYVKALDEVLELFKYVEKTLMEG